MNWPDGVPQDPPDAKPLRFDPRYRCTSPSKRRKPYRCRSRAIPGGKVCRDHGGGAPQVQAAAQRRLERERAEGEIGRMLTALDVDVSDDPFEAVVDRLRYAQLMARVLERLVDALNPTHDPEAKDAKGRVASAIYGPDHLGDGRRHVLMDMLAEWSDRVVRFSDVLVRMGYESVLTALADRHADVIETAVTAVVKALGHDLDDPTIGEKVGRALLSTAIDVPPASVRELPR